MVYRMDQVYKFTIVTAIWVSLKKVRLMALESSVTLMAIPTLGNAKKAKETGKESIYGQVDNSTKEVGKTISSTALVFICLLTG